MPMRRGAPAWAAPAVAEAMAGRTAAAERGSAARKSRRVIKGGLLLADGLRDPQVREEVAELLVAQAVEQAHRHQALARGLDRLDLVGPEGDVLPVEAAEHRDLVV